MSPPSARYSPVNVIGDDESSERLLSEAPDHGLPKASHKTQYRWLWFLLSHALLLCLSFMFLTLWLRARKTSDTRSPDLRYSPIDEAIEYLDNVKFDGSFSSSSIYNGPPGPEIDAAWDKVTDDVPPTRISHAQLLNLGKSDSRSLVKYQAKDGGGVMASLLVIHQLKCLNMLRKHNHPDYYTSVDSSFRVDPGFTYNRLAQCIELLRQELMCNPDLTMVTHNWIKGFDQPIPDLDTYHKCRNFDQILDWGYKNAVDIPREHIVRFGDEVDLSGVP